MSMCGRTRLSTDPDYPAPNVPASWNLCPTDPMLVAVRNHDGKRIPQQMRWGLVAWWAKDIKVGFSSINARAETVDTARAFRDAWKKGQRCLVVTDGFYEWKKPEKQPYAVAMADESYMVMAGLWDEWTDKVLLVPFMDEALTLWPVNRQKINRQRPQQGSRSGVARDVALTWRGPERIRCS